VFLEVFQKHVSSVSSVFGRMLQAFHLDVSKVDRMSYMGCMWEGGGAASVRCRRRRGGAGLCVGAQNAGVGGGMLARARSAGAHAQEMNQMGHGTVRWIVSVRRSGTSSSLESNNR
jgi:hypothetical protein